MDSLQGEPATAVFDTVKYAAKEGSRCAHGQGAIAFQFAQVGNDSEGEGFPGPSLM